MRVKVTIGIVIVAGALALFFLAGGEGSKEVFYFSPSEFRADAKAQKDRVRLKGKIVPGSVKATRDKLDLRFDIGDERTAIPVHYKGAVPDAFQEGLEAVVDGRMGPGGVFECKELVVKCPSKYDAAPTGKGAKMPDTPK